MNYCCPKCGHTMICMCTASIPPCTSYWCMNCNYQSKVIHEKPSNPILPRELWSEEKEETE